MLDRNPIAAALVVSGALFAVAATPARAPHDDSGRLDKEQVSVLLRASSTPPDGPTTDSGSAGPVLAIGEEGEATILAGLFDEDGKPSGEVCTWAAASGSGTANFRQKSVRAWTLKAKVLDARFETVTLALDWTHEVADRPGHLVRKAGDSRVVTLEPGQRHLLDFLGGDGRDPKCPNRNLAIEVEADIREDPSLASKRLRYEIWFTDEAGPSATMSRQATVSAVQGASVSFALPSLDWPTTARVDGDKAARIFARINGGLRGRVRRDGSIDLYFTAHRSLGIAMGDDEGTGLGDSGTTRMNVTPGEPVKLILPEPSGGMNVRRISTGGFETSSWFRDQDGSAVPKSGVEARDGIIAVWPAKFLAGHTMSLTVVAHVE